ncbi:MAG: 50S ribosomal protein L11 methyltransferase [Ignavibacteriaceae bacterium]|nr:50S ribosomal protein L11 methyltransferase [Ignavibacteriaceae bacterium]
MIYKEFIVTAEPFIPDILSGVLWNLNISGISEEVNCLKVFSDSVSKNDIELILNDLLNNKMLFSFTVEENFLEDKNWNAEWEKNRDIIRVTDRIIIKPTFKEYIAKENEIVLIIDPKMSFGTGEHQTTKMMLQLEEKYIKGGMKVLDIGTGTGILAIAAIKLGASTAVANDIDEWCYENGIENSALNSTTEQIDFRICTLDKIEENNFDIIIANIQKNVLIELADEISSRVKLNGVLLLSGLLHIDEKDVLEIYSSLGFIFSETIRMDEWIAIALRNRG